MTTAVYCHKTNQIAIDSRVSSSSLIVSDNFQKWVEQRGFMFFISSSLQDNAAIVDKWFADKPTWKGDKFSCLVVTPKKEVFCYYSHAERLYKLPIAFNDGIGSGMEWALAALDFGRNVEEAIAYAMTRDAATGGKIHVYDIRTGRWDIRYESATPIAEKG